MKKIISLHLLKNSQTPLIEALPLGGKSKGAVTVPKKGSQINLGAFTGEKESALLEGNFNVIEVVPQDNVAQVFISYF